MERDLAAPSSRYSNPTVATLLKEHSKHGAAKKPSERPRFVVRAVEKDSGLLSHHARAHFADLPIARRRSSDRLFLSDDDADDERVRKRSVGRPSYSDDELSHRLSVQRYCPRHSASRIAESASAAQTRDGLGLALLQQVRRPTSSRPRRRECYACNLPAASRCTVTVRISILLKFPPVLLTLGWATGRASSL